MEIILNLFLELKDNFGWFISSIILLLALTFIISWRRLVDLAFLMIHKLIQKEFFRFNYKGIFHHPIFVKFQYLKNQRLKFLKCKCPLRKKIFGDLMTVRINSMEKTLKEFINDRNINSYSESEFQLKLSGMIYDMFLNWEKDAKEHEIPAVIIDKFVESIKDIRDGIVSYIQNSTNSYSNFKNNYAKIYAVLDILSGFEELIIIRFEFDLDSMNGEISESYYKGMKCEHCQTCQSVKISKK